MVKKIINVTGTELKPIGKIDSAEFTNPENTCLDVLIEGKMHGACAVDGDRIWLAILEQKIEPTRHSFPDMTEAEYEIHSNDEIDRIRKEEIAVDQWDDMSDAEKAKWKKHIKSLKDSHKTVNLKGVKQGDIKSARTKMPKF